MSTEATDREAAAPASSGDRDSQLARLRRAVRVAAENSEREADAFFAQYQLSQLLAWATTPATLAESVLTELATLCKAAQAVCWLSELRADDLRLLGQLGAPGHDPPATASPSQVRNWLARSGAWVALDLHDKDGLAGIIALRSEPGGSLDDAGIRVANVTRHELALAFRNVQLRAALEEERRAATAIIESATDAILEIGTDGRVRQTNPAAQRLFGRSSEEAAHLSCGELFGCRVLNSHREYACPVILAAESGKPIEYLETTVVAAGGLPVPVSGSLSPMSRNAGAVTGVTVILRDVEAQAALGELRESFVATVSHELRTPLTIIRGYAESIRLLMLTDEKRSQFAQGIELQTDRISTLIGGILDISHLDADPTALQKSVITIEELIQQLWTLLPTDGLDARLRVDMPFGLPPVAADPRRIGQVLRNLVENAVKYGPADGKITIGARKMAGWIQVYVEDEGPGVPKGDRHFVTEPFHRGRDQRESTVPGYGLGLYIARRLVEAHGGQLRLADRPDGLSGAAATFTLPIAAPLEAPAPDESAK